MQKFRHHPDDRIIIQNGSDLYHDTLENFLVDASLPGYSLATGYLGRIYCPNEKHVLTTQNREDPQDLSWAEGDGYIANAATYLAAKDARENPPLTLEERRVQKLQELSGSASQEIQGGFISNALGSDHHYNAQVDNQVNLIGAVTAVSLTGGSINYTCTEVATNIKSQKSHTQAQIEAVYQTGVQTKQAVIAYFHSLRNQVDAATDIPQVDAVVWAYGA